MQHLEEGEIHAWLDGALSEAEGARIEQHAATCRECAAMVADARGLIAGAARIVSALDHVPSGVIPKSGAAATASRPLWRALRLTPFRAAMAASLVVVAGSLIVVQRKDKELMVPRPDQIAMPMAASVPAPTVAAAPAADTAERMRAPAANEARQLEQSMPRSPQASVSKTTLALKDSTLLMKPAPPNAAPASKVASAEDERAKKERDAALSSVAVKATPASAVGGAARDVAQGQAQAQSGQGKAGAREQSRDSVRSDIALRRAVPPALLRVEATSGFAATPSASFVGCYQVVDTARWIRSLPSRFALTVDSTGGGVQFPMKALVTAGRPDSATIGFWRTLTPTSVRVDFNTAYFAEALTLVRNVNGTTATFSTHIGSGPAVSLTRLDCSR